MGPVGVWHMMSAGLPSSSKTGVSAVLPLYQAAWQASSSWERAVLLVEATRLVVSADRLQQQARALHGSDSV